MATWMITETRGVQTITPDFTYEPGRADRLAERLSSRGLPTNAQAILDAVNELCRFHGQWGPTIGMCDGHTVSIPTMFGTSTGTAGDLVDAYAEALIAVGDDAERKAAWITGGANAVLALYAQRGEV
jgi:hypothetical protein